MPNTAHVSLRTLLSLVALGAMALSTVPGAQGSGAPKYKFDPDWPKPLPNKWKLGGVTGLAVDKDDNVWVLNRPGDLRDLELHAELNPPTADCCVRPPSMIHIDKNGNVIGSFDASNRSRHGRRQQGLRLHRTGHRPEVRPEDRQAGRDGGSCARAGTRIRRRHGGQRTRCGPGARAGPRRRRSDRDVSATAGRWPCDGRPGRPGGRSGGLPREVSAEHADDRRRHRGDPAR